MGCICNEKVPVANSDKILSNAYSSFNITPEYLTNKIEKFLEEQNMLQYNVPVLILVESVTQNLKQDFIFPLYYPIKPSTNIDIGFSFQDYILGLNGNCDGSNISLKTDIEAKSSEIVVHEKTYNKKITKIDNTLTPIKYFELIDKSKVVHKYLLLVYKNKNN